MPSDPAPPVAPQRPVSHELHGVRWTDEYGWMRDHSDPEFLAYLRAERDFYDSATRHLRVLSDELYGEMVRRRQPTDESVRTRRGAFFYYTRTVGGSDYQQFVSSRDQGGAGRVLLDEAQLATGPGGFVALGLREVSPDARRLAYSVDTDGDEVFTLRFRDLTSADARDLGPTDDLPDVVARSYYGGAWSADSSTFFYTVHDRTYRPFQVWRHRIGSPVSADRLVFTEPDARFEVTVRTTRSHEYVVIELESRDTSEAWLIPSAEPEGTPVLVRPRRTGVVYRVDHGGGDDMFMVTNDGPDFRLLRGPVGAPYSLPWTEVAPASAGERLLTCHALVDHLVLELRRDGFPLLRIVDRATGAQREVWADVPAGRQVLHPEFDHTATAVTVQVDSLIEPPRWYTVDLATGERTLVKSLEVPTYDASAYRTRRELVRAPDGTEVPVTLAWRADTPGNGTAPGLMWGYGAYESCADPAFDPALPSLLDRGLVYALVHPRGGGEMGRRWWLDGRLAAKENTFADHLAVADWLAGGLVDGSRLATRGLSAGGLLQAVVLTRRPQRWRAVVAEVPFVDVVTTLLDESIPLTVTEWGEWGDPRKPEDFAMLRAYSPYDTLPPGGQRPALLVTGARHDPRVMVHEPAKWVARLRAGSAPGDGPLLFRVELGAGAHTGPAGRYAHDRYEAEIAAFILDRLVG
jgi:oligopeptidase B